MSYSGIQQTTASSAQHRNTHDLMAWSRAFDDPITLPDGRVLWTLQDANTVSQAAKELQDRAMNVLILMVGGDTTGSSASIGTFGGGWSKGRFLFVTSPQAAPAAAPDNYVAAPPPARLPVRPTRGNFSKATAGWHFLHYEGGVGLIRC